MENFNPKPKGTFRENLVGLGLAGLVGLGAVGTGLVGMNKVEKKNRVNGHRVEDSLNPNSTKIASNANMPETQSPENTLQNTPTLTVDAPSKDTLRTETPEASSDSETDGLTYDPVDSIERLNGVPVLRTDAEKDTYFATHAFEDYVREEFEGGRMMLHTLVLSNEGNLILDSTGNPEEKVSVFTERLSGTGDPTL